MTKRDLQAADYAREACECPGEYCFAIGKLRHMHDVRCMERAYRRDTLGIRVHRAVSKWLRYVWLRFVGH